MKKRILIILLSINSVLFIFSAFRTKLLLQMIIASLPPYIQQGVTTNSVLNIAISIGIIGGADGPTAIFISGGRDFGLLWVLFFLLVELILLVLLLFSFRSNKNLQKDS